MCVTMTIGLQLSVEHTNGSMLLLWICASCYGQHLWPHLFTVFYLI